MIMGLSIVQLVNKTMALIEQHPTRPPFMAVNQATQGYSSRVRASVRRKVLDKLREENKT